MIDSILSEVLVKSGSRTFYTFSNADGKTWIMPHRNMATAMNLYQPGGINGKLMKRFFPYLKGIGIIRNLLNITVSNYELSVQIEALLQSVFRGDVLEWAVFCGTPSKHQKITMQISQGNRILGYCKFSDREEVKALFSHEQIILNALRKKQIAQIPECLYFGDLENNTAVFIQSTGKTNHSKVLHQWNDWHWNFLTDLKNKTKQTLLFEQTDFYSSINFLQQNISCVSENERDVVCKAIEKILHYYKNSIVTFSVYHGDFTPWNMFVEKNQLFVFDWEYAQLTYPAYLDWFHFFTQYCIFEKHLQSEEIYHLYTQKKCKPADYVENTDFYYKCYLLDIISRYTNRDKGVFNKDMANSMNIWIKLIEKLDFE